MAEIQIRFNGEQKPVKSGTIAELLEEFNLAGQKLAVELNRQIVTRTSYAQTKISSGDNIEIVHFVGGG